MSARHDDAFLRRKAGAMFRRKLRAAQKNEGSENPNDDDSYLKEAAQRFNFSIPLRPRDRPVNFSDEEISRIARSEYAHKYLEQIGAEPTVANIKLVEKNMGLEKCRVMAAWKTRGGLSDNLYITPNWAVTKQPSEESGPRQDTLKRRYTLRNAAQEKKVAPSDESSSKSERPVASAEITSSEEQVQHVNHYTMKFETLQDVKRLFVYPFNLHLPMYQNLKWGDEAERRETIRRDLADELGKPLDVSRKDIRALQRNCESLFRSEPLLVASARSAHTLFTSSVVVKLVGLLCHHCYWNVLLDFWRKEHGKDCAAMLELEKKEALLVQILKTFHEMRREQKPEQLTLCLLSIRVSVARIIQRHYPLTISALSDKTTNACGVYTPAPARVLRTLDKSILQMLDPDGFFSRVPLLESTPEAIRIIRGTRKKPSRKKMDYRSTSTLCRVALPQVKNASRLLSESKNRKALYEAALGGIKQRHQAAFSRKKAKDLSRLIG